MIEAHIIDITNVKKILNCCPYYDDIVSYDIPYDDELSIDLIDWYKDLIFSCDGDNTYEVDIIKIIDKCMYMYTCSSKYRNGLKKIIDVKDIDLNSDKSIRKMIKKLLEYNNNYETMEVLNITSSKWL